MPGRVASYDDLVAFLTEENATFKHDPATRTIELGVDGGTLFVRWDVSAPYLQLIVPLIRGVPEARKGDVEEAVCRLNHALALPGFAYDFAKHFLYFRATVPYDGEGLSPGLLRHMIAAVAGTARARLASLRAVVAGDPGAKILA